MANAALASRKDGRDAVVAARKGQAAWAAATPYNRGQVMYRIAEMLEGRRAELVQPLRDLSGLSVAPGVARGGPRGRLARAPRRLDGQARDGHRQRQRGQRARTSPTPRPSPPGSSSRAAPAEHAAARPRLGARARRGRRQRGGRGRPEAERLRRRCAGRGAGHLRRARRRGQPPHRPRRRGAAAPRGPRRRQRSRPDRRGRRAAGRAGAGRRPGRSSGSTCRARPFDPEAAPGTARLRAFLETKTVWHPTGAPSLAGGSSYEGPTVRHPRSTGAGRSPRLLREGACHDDAMDLGLKDRVYIVSGASRGLGHATAAQLVAEGARVVLCSREESRAVAAAEALGDTDRVVGLAGDLADPEVADRLVATALERFGRLDGTVISVGGPPPGPAATSSDDTWRTAFESVFLGPLRLARAVLASGDDEAVTLRALVVGPQPDRRPGHLQRAAPRAGDGRQDPRRRVRRRGLARQRRPARPDRHRPGPRARQHAW